MGFFSQGGSAEDDERADTPAAGGLGDISASGGDAVALPDLSSIEDGSPSPTLPVLSTARIQQALERLGYRWSMFPDNTVTGQWERGVFYFMVQGQRDEILQVVAKCTRSASIDRLEDLLAVINQWHIDKIWPKAYARVQDNGVVNLYTEHNTDLEFGVRDDQLDLLLACAVNTSLTFFAEIDARYPDPLTQSPA